MNFHCDPDDSDITDEVMAPQLLDLPGYDVASKSFSKQAFVDMFIKGDGKVRAQTFLGVFFYE